MNRTLETFATLILVIGFAAFVLAGMNLIGDACAGYDPAGPMIVTTAEGQQCCCYKRNGQICCRTGFSCIGCFCA